MSVKNFLKEIETMSENEMLAYLQSLADEMKERVLSTESTYFPKGRIIYMSADGNDNNDGLSEEKPIATLAHAEEIMQDNDTFLLRRGDMFRGSIIVKHHHINFSAYGTGRKPIINSSAHDYADEKYWLPTEHKNVWKCTELLDNVGIVHYNTTREYGNYGETCGFMMVLGRTPNFSGEADLKDEYTFYSNLETKELFVCAPDNPGKIYSSIEIGVCVNTIRGYASHLTVDNIHIQHCGAHGVQDVVGSHLTVRNCVFDWLGGSILKGFAGGNTVRYGNAVEVGRCDGYLVKNNWMYQIYDTGITHQTGPQSKCDVHQYDVMYLDNLVEYCFWSLEFYNGQNEFDRDTKNVYICGNFCRFGGFGWGCRGRENGAPMFSSAYGCDNTEDFCVENNIFDRCTGSLISMRNDAGNARISFRSNAYIQPAGKRFLCALDKTYNFDENVKDTIAEVIGDKTAVTYALSDWCVTY